MQDSRRSWYAGFLVLAAISLIPFLRTGFYFDDSLNSLLYASLRFHHQGLWPFIEGQILDWIRHTGRFFPVSLIVDYSLWYTAFRSLSAYRAIQCGLVVVDIALFLAVLRSLGASGRRSLLAGLVLLPLFQLRSFHDPIASYAAMMQLISAMGFAAILLLRRGRVVASYVLCALVLLYYEVALVFVPILALISLREPRGSRASRAWIGYLLIAFGDVAFAMGLRATFPVTYPGLKVSLSWLALRAFAYQLSAAWPLVYAIFGRSGFYTLSSLMRAWCLPVACLGLFAVYFRAALALLREGTWARSERVLSWIGWLLLLGPTLMMAISARYQLELNRPGMGYLPVYLCYFGTAILLSGVLARFKPRGRAAAAGVLAFAFAVNFWGNWSGAAQLNQQFKDRRALFESAVESGALARLPNPCVLLHESRYQDWLRDDYLALLTGKRITPVLLDDFRGSADTLMNPATVFLGILPRGSDSGLLFVAHALHAQWDVAHRQVLHLYSDAPIEFLLHGDAQVSAASELRSESFARPLAQVFAAPPVMGWYRANADLRGVDLLRLHVEP